MVKISGSKDCGNSPKNQLVEKVAIAIEVGDLSFLKEYLDDEIIWERSDNLLAEGQEVSDHIEQRKNKLSSVTITHVISHGKIGAVNGVSTNNQGEQIHFCHVIAFSSVKFTRISRLCSYGRP
ncbi:hypothetical protein [Microbulbifer sp. HZ11]|uniref:hypothetical protein n=1 Tax=unclassified Microbulbifer TaxID=2619833 RepID=UPI0006920F00|nr:hypothetical protein [Microbulbifer sp. HZ11]